MKAASSQVRVWSPDAVLESVDACVSTASSRLLVVGQWPHRVDERWAERVGILDVSARPRVLLDAWLHRESIPELCARLTRWPAGGWDVMFATSWHWLWGGAPFSLWSRRGLAARVLGPGRVVLRTLGLEREHAVHRVCAGVGHGWVVHSVGVQTSEGRTVRVARRTEMGRLLDPTYDGLNHLGDVAWASALGHRLAEALQVPYEANDKALE
jgi:hypothetical protein